MRLEHLTKAEIKEILKRKCKAKKPTCKEFVIRQKESTEKVSREPQLEIFEQEKKSTSNISTDK